MNNKKAAENDVVVFHFTLLDGEGTLLDSTEGDSPEHVLLGSGELIPALEEVFLGKKAGDKFEVPIEADNAYGEYRDDLEIELKLSDFPETPEIDEEYLLEDDDMALPYRVEGIEGNKVFMNGNHLFAGKDVLFQIEIVDIREATEEELEHGHAHFPGDEHDHE
jgi:FKBP-type peptidyl-prolyl cis-trans isomerase SlyD